MLSYRANVVCPEGVSSDSCRSPGPPEAGGGQLPQLLHLLLPTQDDGVSLTGDTINDLNGALLAAKLKQ